MTIVPGLSTGTSWVSTQVSKATLFKAELYAWSHPGAHDGWFRLIEGTLEVRPIPGRHFEIMKPPHLEALAAELSDCLRRAQAPVADAAE